MGRNDIFHLSKPQQITKEMCLKAVREVSLELFLFFLIFCHVVKHFPTPDREAWIVSKGPKQCDGRLAGVQGRVRGVSSFICSEGCNEMPPYLQQSLHSSCQSHKNKKADKTCNPPQYFKYNTFLWL